MVHVIKSIRGLERQMDTVLTHLTRRHPYLAFFCAFAGVPLVILLSLFALISVIMLPLSLICGWL